MQVNLNYLRQIKEVRERINAAPLESIQWFNGDIPVELTEEQKGAIKDWADTGLNNVDFADLYILTEK